jgi:methionyl-tRNA synthetase
MNHFYLTTPIYYLNGEAHLGHAYTTVQADIIARFQRLLGKEVFFLTGSDEHGQKIAEAAKKASLEPQTLVDNLAKNFQDLWQNFDISYDYFIRTTNLEHKAFIQEIWKKMEAKGYLYLGNYSGWYSVRDEAFYSEEDLIDGKAPTGGPVEWLTNPSYFFKLSTFQEKLLAFYEANPDFVIPKSRFNEVQSFVKSGLRDLSVSRLGLTWGIEVPSAPDHTIYVWLDALFNYLSGVKINHKENYWPCDLHLVGKDILIFHAVYWPAFLMSLDLPLPKQILAHGWWTNEGEKMSKSLGNVLDPRLLLEKYGRDYLTYFLVREIPLGQDGNFSDQALINRVKGELINNIGNLVQRVASLASKEMSNIIAENPDESEELIIKAYKNSELFFQFFNQYKFSEAIKILLEIGQEANGYMEKRAPWQEKKTDRKSMEKTLCNLLEVIRILGILLQPIIPEGARKILAIFGYQEEKCFSNLITNKIQKGEQILPPGQIFKPLDFS